ncbi:AAA family ATPase [Veillonella sp.]|jgi:putative ATP/GTP-binding protein|uniref:ATP-dependent nuclease n=2 Tax=Veillonella sp. TaxID=1926307 RepID=UPI00290CBB4A|nr:AAA family ATPase [Veillonella sp.]MDU3631330.1 AAA family ATPase [Veillonella sp.]
MLKSLKVANYKNIGSSFIGFDNLEKFNILIGRNNIGKSNLLSILKNIRYIDSNDILDNDLVMDIEFSIQLDSVPTNIFPHNEHNLIFGNYFEYGQTLLGKIITYEFSESERTYHIKSIGSEAYRSYSGPNNSSEVENLLIQLGRYSLSEFNKTYKIIKLDADRNLLPEVESTSLNVETDGSGATNFIRTYLHNSAYNFKVVEKEILDALNKIVLPDEHFERIMCQEILSDADTKWEIHLVNENGRIPLSSSGSGLRTILLVLIKLFLEASNSQRNIFIFEELENNIHPTIQRNLFNYLYNWAIEKDDIFFITTHSNVPINMFGNMPSISITHIKKNIESKELITESAFSFSSNSDILNDLGVKASDILQSNAIIWVEGPSDRIYINKWIELASDGILRENTHYQILFYGGRLLSHLTGKTKCKEPSELINLFLANRNSILVMDSDKKHSNGRINKTKQRIIKEFTDSGSIAWITKGREIENYLSQSVINKEYDINKQIGQFECIGEFLNENKQNSKYGDKYTSNKYKKSIDLVKHMTLEDIDVLDLKEKIEQIVKKIKEWNYIK